MVVATVERTVDETVILRAVMSAGATVVKLVNEKVGQMESSLVEMRAGLWAVWRAALKVV